jgi:hypothetical protein
MFFCAGYTSSSSSSSSSSSDCLHVVYPVHIAPPYATGPKYEGVSGKYIAEQSGPNNPGGVKGSFDGRGLSRAHTRPRVYASSQLFNVNTVYAPRRRRQGLITCLHSSTCLRPISAVLKPLY